MHARRTALHALGSLCLLATAIQAQEREFTQSRDWNLPKRGELELELRSFTDTTNGEPRGQLEAEYGATDHLTLGTGIEVSDNEDGDLEFAALGAELRANFGSFRRNAWLPALSLEYEHALMNDETDKLEVKGILSRYGLRDDFTINLNYARFLEGSDEVGRELTAGWLHTFADAAPEDFSWTPRLGLEAVQDFEMHTLRAGPLAVWRLGEEFHLLVSYLPAIDERHDQNFDELSLILEWEL